MRFLRWLPLLLVAAPLAAQTTTPDLLCRDSARVNLDTLARIVPPPARDQTNAQVRARTRLDAIYTARCITYLSGPTNPPTPRTLAASVGSLTFAALAGGSSPVSQTVNLTNIAGSAAITSLGASVTYTSGTPGWLSLSLSSTATPSTLTATPATGSLGAGSYAATIAVTGDSAGTINVPVTLTVSTGPIVVATPTGVSWTITAGDPSPAAATVTITNGGGGTLSGLTAGSISYGTGQPTGWAAAGLSGVTGSGGTLTLTPTVIGLAAGVYTFSLQVTATGATSATVTGSLTVNPVVTTPPPPPPTSGGIAELPRYTPTARSPLAAQACTDTISSGLQAAINAATMGDVLCVTSGLSFTGNLTIPARGDTGWVEVRGLIAQSGSFAQGTRIRPSTAGLLPKIRGTSTTPTITFSSQARGWAFTLLEITTDSTLTTGPNAIVNMPDKSAAADTIAKIIFDRAYVHGWTAQTVIRCFIAHARWLTIIDSWLDDCHAKGTDSQAIVAWGYAGPWLIRNNYLAGAGENVMLGGAKGLQVGELPRDITFDHNHFNTPSSWKSVWTKKNVLEVKFGQRLLFEYNRLEGSWTDGQVGTCVVIWTANQSISGFTWASTNDVTYRYNLCVNVGTALGVVGQASVPLAARVDSNTRRVLLLRNYNDSIDVAGSVFNGGELQMSLYNNVTDLQVVENTWDTPGPVTTSGSTLINAIVLGSGSAISATRLVWRKNTMHFGRYGIVGCSVPGPRGLGCLLSPSISQSALVTNQGTLNNYPTGFSAYPSLASALAYTGSITRAQIDALLAGVKVSP